MNLFVEDLLDAHEFFKSSGWIPIRHIAEPLGVITDGGSTFRKRCVLSLYQRIIDDLFNNIPVFFSTCISTAAENIIDLGIKDVICSKIPEFFEDFFFFFYQLVKIYKLAVFKSFFQ